MSRKLTDFFNEEEQQQTPDEVSSLQDLKSEIIGSYEAKSKKKTIEDTHTRTTFLLENELLDRLNKLSKGKRGFKTMIFNKAIAAILDELEK